MMHPFAPALVAACLLCPGLTWAEAAAPEAASPPLHEDVAPGQPLGLADALHRALAGNPELQGFTFRLRAADAAGLIAGLRPRPGLSLDVENLLGTGAVSGLSGTETTLALSQLLELGGKRQARLAAASASRDSLSIARESAQLDVVAEVTRRFVHVAADQEQIALTRRATALARDTLVESQRRVDAARAPEVELRRARIGVTRALLDEEHAEHELAASRYRLAAMWGASEADFGPVSAALDQLPELEGFDALRRRLSRNPDALRYASEARLREAEIRLAEAQRRPDLSLKAGLRRLEAEDDTAFVAGVSVPLFGSTAAAYQRSQAVAEQGRSAAEAEAHRVRVEAQLYALYQELHHAIVEVDSLQREILPEMEAALTDTEYAFQRGRYGYLEWVEAQQSLIALYRNRIEAAAEVHLLTAEIERLVAEPLSTAPGP
jgi:cobalt-zinc-cadmium efflux system outer membrane protein